MCAGTLVVLLPSELNLGHCEACSASWKPTGLVALHGTGGLKHEKTCS